MRRGLVQKFRRFSFDQCLQQVQRSQIRHRSIRCPQDLDAIQDFVGGRLVSEFNQDLTMAVFFGRTPIFGLACGGEDGAHAALMALRDELERTLALLGAASLAAVERGHVLQGSV